MKSLRLLLASAALLSLGAVATTSCNSESEDENASIVNVEKGVAPAISVSEAPADAKVVPQAVGIVTSNETDEVQPAEEGAPAEEPQEKVAEKSAEKVSEKAESTTE